MRNGQSQQTQRLREGKLGIDIALLAPRAALRGNKRLEGWVGSVGVGVGVGLHQKSEWENRSQIRGHLQVSGPRKRKADQEG